jgi:hypothetical protein
VLLADDDGDDDGGDDDGGSSGGGSTGGGASGGGSSSGGGSTGTGGSSGGGSTGGGSHSSGGSAGTGGSSGGGSTGGGGPSGGGSSGGGKAGGGGSSGGDTDDDADDDDDGDDDDESSGSGSRGADREDRDDDRDRADDRSGTRGRAANERSGLAQLRDFFFGRSDPPADREDRFRPGEILAIDLSAEARQRIVRAGFAVAEQRRLAGLGITLTRLVPPPERTLAEALELARGIDPATVFDLNSLYDRLACTGCWSEAALVVGPAPGRCRARVRLGLLDTGVDTRHPALADARITSRRFLPAAAVPASPEHGTAVASLLVGSRLGLLPTAELRVAEIFAAGAGGSAEADTFALASGLDWLVQERASVVNASLAGPRNRLLELAVYLARRRGVVVVAAAGNGGPSAPPAYPAAYAGVVAVTAVDNQLRPWRRANRGAYIAFAAPGVDVPTAAPGGAIAPASGTSFAAPFVTAALAAAAGRGGDPRAALALLAGKARDLGDPGQDPVFGHGLVQAAGCRS